MRFRQAVATLLLFGGLALPAAAEDEPTPLTAEATADAVLAALSSEDAAALSALAARDQPDPWIVADVLLSRGALEAAEAFAGAARRRDTEQLPAYLATRREDPAQTEARAAFNRARAAFGAQDPEAALTILEQVKVEPRTVLGVTVAFERGLALARLRRWRESAAAYTQAAQRAGDLGWWRVQALAFGDGGRSAFRRSDYATALTLWDRWHAAEEGRNDPRGIADALEAKGNVHTSRGDHRKALALQEQALALREAQGDRRGVARSLANMAVLHDFFGDYPRAIALNGRALAAFDEIGDERSAVTTLGNLGVIHKLLGDYPKAREYQDRALAISEKLGDSTGMARALANIGTIHQALRDYKGALSYSARALKLCEELGSRAGVARLLGTMGEIHLGLGEHDKALSHAARALDISETIGDRHGVARMLRSIGNVHWKRGEYAEALAFQERSLALFESTGERSGVLRTLANIGQLHRSLGDVEKATSLLERVVRESRRLRERDVEVRTGAQLALTRLRQGQHARALMGAQRGVQAAEGLLGGLAEEEGASAREAFATLFGVGALAAARLEEPAEVLAFLEGGRAGSLLETLGGGGAVRHAHLPAALAEAEAEAKTAETRARREYRRALNTGHRKEIRRTARAVDDAMDVRREIAARIQRKAKHVAGVFYPRAATLEEIQGWMAADTALVLYGLCVDEALALIVTTEDARILSLGTAKDVEAACDALAAHDHTSSAESSIMALRTLLVDPLALEAEMKTVLVSPDGALGYVPWGALFDRPVACVPSGTTWVLLREEEREPGTKILALGDPDYATHPDARTAAVYTRGGRLMPLPATRDEAKAIGDVVLLGADASEPALKSALGKEKRWRAVHLACHGLVDAERPTLSSLALTPTDDEDGFLTCLDICRMQVPTDLVVLSACETAKGRVVKAEGIVGLTRAFMYAGAPRVLCSLWKVDDEATRTLMTKFYALWNPEDGEGLPAAEALRQAQAHVRDSEKWAHPYYWAAWVLWGLAE